MSANLDDCLKYIIGLSRTECQCHDADKPDEYNSSDSGIYLDELIDLDLINAAKDCSANSVWAKMINARDQAVKEFKTDLLSCIVSKTKLKRKPYNGIIGDYKKFSKDIQSTTTYTGTRIRFADIVGGFAKIRRIGLLFSATNSVTVSVYNNIQSTPVITYSNVPTTAGQLSWFTLPSVIDIDMNSDFSDFVEYYFIVEYNPANAPKDTKFSCNCGGYHPSWDENYPQYNNNSDKGNFGWAEFAMASGIKGNDISQLINYPSNWASDNYTYGILLDVQFGCKAEKTICNESLDYISNPYAMAMAYAVRFKAAEILIKDILKTSNPSYYTVLASELLPSMAKEFREEYEARVKLYLCPEIASPDNIGDYSDCFTCKDEHGFIKSGIFN
jgi:hypothetical protein